METQEEFRPVAGFEGKYEVSNFGRVKSLNYHRENREAFLRGAIDRYGYQKVTFCLNAKQSTHLIHRLVADAFLPAAVEADAITVNHIDGNKRNNRADNLEWMSFSDNTKHAYAIGISNCQGENSGMSKLTDEQVTQLRRDYKTMSVQAISRKFGISVGSIGPIASGRTWKHLPVIDYSDRKARITEPVPGFIEAAIAVHGAGRYDYSKVNYVNSRTHVTIICAIHGEFSQKPCGHVAGQGCPKCAVIKRRASLLNKKLALIRLA